MSSTAPVAVQPAPERALGRLVGRRVRDWVPAVVVLVLAIGAWEAAIPLLHVKKFLLPQPSTIWNAFWDTRAELLHAGWLTFKQALGGFAVGSGLAIVVALVLARFRAVGRALMPYAIAANAIPIIAFAPITNAWFNPLTKSSKMAVAAVLVFFPCS